MTDPHYTDITMILDRSGSMQSIKTDIEGGFDAFITDQQAEAGRCTVSLVQFDDRYEEVYRAKAVTEVPPLTLRPRGSTALLDAIGRTVSDVGARLAAMPEGERPGTVIIGIMTDGLENASREFTRPMITAMINEQEKIYGWAFLYLGANQDAVEVGTSLGIAADRALTYAPAAASEAMRAYSASIGRTRRARAAGASAAQVQAATGFTAQERSDAG